MLIEDVKQCIFCQKNCIIKTNISNTRNYYYLSCLICAKVENEYYVETNDLKQVNYMVLSHRENGSCYVIYLIMENLSWFFKVVGPPLPKVKAIFFECEIKENDIPKNVAELENLINRIKKLKAFR